VRYIDYKYLLHVACNLPSAKSLVPESLTRKAAPELAENNGGPMRLPVILVTLPPLRWDETALMLQPMKEVTALASETSIRLLSTS